MDSLNGRLLVATPAIDGGPFRRSVVFILEHDENGALGVVVNHPLDADVEDLLPRWGEVVKAPVCLFGGGPVAVDSALALGITSEGAEPHGWQQMTGRVGLLDLDGPLPSANEFSGVRVFIGYAGWGPEQLEAELTEGTWVVADVIDGDLLTPSPDQLWSEVLRRQDGDIRFLATYPDDPNLN